MHFITEEVWEIRDPLMQSLQGASGSRLYPCVEVSLNIPIWHLGLRFQVANEISHWRRFIFASVEHVAATLQKHEGECSLHLQSARQRDESREYEIWPVQRLEAGRTRDGHTIYVVKLTHESLTFPDRTIDKSDVAAFTLVYENHPAC